jgi:hypothetical protein
MRAVNSASTCRTIRPGTPITSDPGGTRIPSGTSAPAATTLRPDVHAVEENAAHPDQTIILDGAAVQDRAMSHPDPGADGTGKPLVHVDDGAVLDVGPFANDDRRHVTPEHRRVPDARLLAEGDVAEDDGGGRNEGGRMDQGLTGSNRVCVQLTTGLPSLVAGDQSICVA